MPTIWGSLMPMPLHCNWICACLLFILISLGHLKSKLHRFVAEIVRFVCIINIWWWRHQMEALPALLAICAGNSPVTGEFPAQRPVTPSFDVFFDLHPNKRLSKQSWGWWFETPPRSLWRNCNVKCQLCAGNNIHFRLTNGWSRESVEVFETENISTQPQPSDSYRILQLFETSAPDISYLIFWNTDSGPFEKQTNKQNICIVFVAQIVIMCIELSLRYAWWSHGHYGVSHQLQLNCLFSNLIMGKRQKSTPRRLLYVWGSHRCQMVSPHTGCSNAGNHYNDVIMPTEASQITSLTIVYSIVYSGAYQRKHQSSASLAFVRGIHRDRWIPHTKGQ